MGSESSASRLTIAVPRARLNTSDGKTTEWQNKTLPAYRRRTKEIEALIAEGDTVAARVEFTATQAGSFRGFPPANQRVTFSGMDVFRFKDGKIAERWAQRDFLGMLEKLGHLVRR